MSNLILKGKSKVEGMEFNHIEGGFGEGKKSILAKDIAEIHNRALDEINRAINRNFKRFTNNVDLVDLRDTDFVPNLVSNGIYTQNAINRSNNIYLLSERGYSKLLKILEDDFAWDQYEKLVDGYFNMRQVIKENSLDVAKMINQQVNIILGEVDTLNTRVDYLEDNMTVDYGQQNTIRNKTKSKVVGALGGIKSHAYKNKSLKSKLFSRIWRDYQDYFNVASYRDTARVDFQKALDYLGNWQVQGKLLREIEDCNNQIDVDEIA